jgi:hypothetical protein
MDSLLLRVQVRGLNSNADRPNPDGGGVAASHPDPSRGADATTTNGRANRRDPNRDDDGANANARGRPNRLLV